MLLPKNNRSLLKSRKVWLASCLLLASISIAMATKAVTLPFNFAVQSFNENCLDAKLIFMSYGKKTIERGSWVIFKPFGMLSYVKDPHIVKIASGLPGDHLKIVDGNTYINDKLVATGLPDAPIVKKTPKELERDEIIPQGKYFITATHPLSFDSRYWGYLDESQIEGKGYRLF